MIELNLRFGHFSKVVRTNEIIGYIKSKYPEKVDMRLCDLLSKRGEQFLNFRIVSYLRYDKILGEGLIPKH